MPQADSKSYSEQEQQQISAKKIPYTSPLHENLENNTIDVFELFITIWKYKWLIIALTVVAALGSIVYALTIPKIYKAEALLLPPKLKDFQSINILENKKISQGLSIKMERLSSENVFNMFKQNLKSRSIHKKFIKQNGLIEFLAPDRTVDSRDEDVYQGFTKLIVVNELKDGVVSLSVKLQDGEIAAQWINSLTKFVDKETIRMLVDDLNNSLQNQTREIEYNISSKRLMAKKRRQDQIIRYLENATIAKELGMLGRVDATNIIQSTQGNNVDLANATTPLYYLGYEALMTEVKILRNRKSDDPFISGLRDLEENLAMLKKIKIDKEEMRTVYIDQPAFPPKYAIAQNRRLIVSVITVITFFSGIFMAFLIEFLKSQRKKRS